MDATELTKTHLRQVLPARPADGHKGTFGHAYLIAGSRGFTGAAKLAAMAATRSGAGLVTLGVPQPLGDVVAAGLTDVMTMLLPATKEETVAAHAVEKALDVAEHKDAVGIGPGLSQHPDVRVFVHAFVAGCPVPLVIDADGLNALSGQTELLRETKAPCIITPHPGEMSRLTGYDISDIQRDRVGAARSFAKEHGCVVVLKGHRTIVAAPDGVAHINTTGNSGMATGGTGDILTGLLTGLLAQGMPAPEAARLGVYLHGLAGDLAAVQKTERGMIAGDVIDALPTAWRILEGAFDA